VKVFVTGATGAIGGHAVPALIAQEHTVTAIARTDEKAAVLARQGAASASVSLFDRAALTEAFAGHDAIINLATSIPRQFLRASAWEQNDRIRTEGSAAIVDAALAAGVPRVIQESVCMLYADQGRSWIDEEMPIDAFPMARANIAAETSIARFTAAGGAGIVLRFGWFYGPGAGHSEEMFALARRRIGLVLGPAENYLSSIHMHDGGTAVAAALHAPAGTFNVVDDEPLTKREYAAALASAAERKLWLRLPGRSALLLGDRLTSLTRSVRVSNRKLRTTTRWSPRYRSAREGWIATAGAIRDGIARSAHVHAC